MTEVRDARSKGARRKAPAVIVPISPDPRLTREMGLRASGKIERQRRIKEAAKAVFVARGYDAATTRDIAVLAGVSNGTLFVYAQDKRDLLFLVFNDDLDPVSERAFASIPADGRGLDRICALLRPWYDYFAANVALARCAFREMSFQLLAADGTGNQGERFRTRLARIEAWIAQILADAQARGELDPAAPLPLLARIVFFLYLAEARQWVHADAPVADVGIARLRESLAAVVDRWAPFRPADACQPPAQGSGTRPRARRGSRTPSRGSP